VAGSKLLIQDQVIVISVLVTWYTEKHNTLVYPDERIKNENKKQKMTPLPIKPYIHIHECTNTQSHTSRLVLRGIPMAAKGRKQKACFLQWNLGETLETHLAGKANEKRQNFDPSTPPACAENLHFKLNGETRRTPRPPVACAQMAWKYVDKVS
jgi:hypothetical protein